jgi:acyl-coenzyme A thioesterase PaaI-like protein
VEQLRREEGVMSERVPASTPADEAAVHFARPGPEGARFGEEPLAQTVAAAGAIRRLSSLLLSLEHAHPTVDAILAQLGDWERELAAAAPPDSAPRIGTDDYGTRRIYLDHATDIGAFNPCFPEYSFDHLDADVGSGRVTFPLVYEGPPGLVHGGFLAVFFDCVMQHQSCVAGRSGKTRSLSVTFRRPTPVLTELRFDITRCEVDRAITSNARLVLDGEVLCVGEVNTLAQPPDKLAGSQFGKRRAETT